MHRDLSAVAGRDFLTEICVIGAGAAGISMARLLLEAGHDVMLLESGGLDYEPGTAALNKGEISGLDYYDLEHARLRFFGGTTAIWGGRSAELDPIDFEKRPWIPHSGWPISWAEMQPYYRRARKLLGLKDPPMVGRLAASDIAIPVFDPDRIRPKIWTFDDVHGRFSFPNCKDLEEHPRCRIITHATVREIRVAPNGAVVDHLDVANSSGERIKVRARHYVLAAGGIENARLLLASTSVMPTGIGNAHDWVGRCFMEHPHARGGRVTSGKSWALLNAFARKHRIDGQSVAALLTTGEAFQHRHEILNSSLTVVGRRPPGRRESLALQAYGHIKHDMAPDRRGRALWMSAKKAVHSLLRYSEPARPWLLHRLGTLDLALLVRAEQSPNRESRVMLTSSRDTIGMPTVSLQWRMNALDVRSVSGLVDALGGELERLGLGQVEKADWLDGSEWQFDPLVSMHPIGGYHHMGTTRMADDPRQGVADGHGRVHGIQNLWLAGSSLFPTSGWANPTLTILALVCRTSDELIRQLAISSRPRTLLTTVSQHAD
ncbi:FAD-dependent oxidoreductase [Sphingobium yanoikuyae]|jgi:choline dehydrogenase-like flavoprotein|uniref:FAD-dependent oxidoreductase n=1 Tax=Sphingobium yanoikuyae TaxID=13690 RepID=UPI003B8FD520